MHLPVRFPHLGPQLLHPANYFCAWVSQFEWMVETNNRAFSTFGMNLFQWCIYSSLMKLYCSQVRFNMKTMAWRSAAVTCSKHDIFNLGIPGWARKPFHWVTTKLMSSYMFTRDGMNHWISDSLLSKNAVTWDMFNVFCLLHCGIWKYFIYFPAFSVFRMRVQTLHREGKAIYSVYSWQSLL